MPELSVMFKTVSTDCNLDCAYCYYRVSLEGSRARRRMDVGFLERFIPQYMSYVADVGTASMAWQGGEPTLAGLPFFHKVVALQASNAAPGTTISNSLQTNGVLLDDEWCEFLSSFNFLVGVSIDGPQPVHDQPRRFRNGRGSFDLVMRGVSLLRRHSVDVNVLCVVGPHNVGRADELMGFFEAEGLNYVQFIPAMDFQASEPDRPASYLISAEQYGAFLCAAFDRWYGGGGPTISIRIFDNFLQSYLGLRNDLCVHGDRCDAGIVVEYDGSAYPCDFYVHPDWKLGNVLDTPLEEIAAGAARAAFIARKAPLPEECVRCEWLSVCKSGCPRNRSVRDGSPTPDYFSPAYRQLFAHADARLRELKAAVGREWQRIELRLGSAPAAAVGGNTQCACGSGQSATGCCDRPDRDASYIFRQLRSARPFDLAEMR